MNDLDRLLSEDDLLVPSTGFNSRVMDAVAEAATEPPPLPFPWMRFGVLVLACAAWTASTAWLATTPAISELWSTLDGELDPTIQTLQNVGVIGALTLALVFVTARWRPDRAPTP